MSIETDEIQVVRCVVRPPGRNDVLLVKRSNDCNNTRSRGKWELPGGKLADGEDILAAAKREVFEETGMNIQLLQWPQEVSAYTIPNGKHAGRVCRVLAAGAVTTSGVSIELDPQEHTHAMFASGDRVESIPQLDSLSLEILGQLSVHRAVLPVH